MPTFRPSPQTIAQTETIYDLSVPREQWLGHMLGGMSLVELCALRRAQADAVLGSRMLSLRQSA